MAQQQNTPVVVYSRWLLQITGVPYRPGTGAIVNFEDSMTSSDKQVAGFTGDGSQSGVMRGDYKGTLRFVELYPDPSQLVSFRAMLMSTPNAQITATPISLNSYDPIGNSTVYAMIGFPSSTQGNQVESEALRTITLSYGWKDPI